SSRLSSLNRLKARFGVFFHLPFQLRVANQTERPGGQPSPQHLAYNNLKSSLTVVRTMWVFVRSTKGMARSALVSLLRSSRLLNFAITIASVSPVTSYTAST